MTLYRNTALQIMETYARLADEARYRPAAPSDGFGNITVPREELDLVQEQWDYAQAWHGEEDSLQYHVGSPNFSERPALIFLIEAARNLCGMDYALARTLLRMALAELEGKSSIMERYARAVPRDAAREQAARMHSRKPLADMLLDRDGLAALPDSEQDT